MTAGPGVGNPALDSLLEASTLLSFERAEWPIGALEVSAYGGAAELPDALVTSVRCIVTVAGQLLVTQTVHGDVGIVPGGRREPGETWQQTAMREVHEETGCTVHPESLQMVGFLHFRHLAPVPDDHPYPSPDFLQVVFRGTAEPAPTGWVDTEGYVAASWLIDRERAAELEIDVAERALLATFL